MSFPYEARRRWNAARTHALVTVYFPDGRQRTFGGPRAVSARYAIFWLDGTRWALLSLRDEASPHPMYKNVPVVDVDLTTEAHEHDDAEEVPRVPSA